MRAGRVHKEFQGIGVARDMDKVPMVELTKKYKNLKQQVWTSHNHEVHEGVLKRRPHVSLIVVRVRIIQQVYLTNLDE